MCVTIRFFSVKESKKQRGNNQMLIFQISKKIYCNYVTKGINKFMNYAPRWTVPLKEIYAIDIKYNNSLFVVYFTTLSLARVLQRRNNNT